MVPRDVRHSLATTKLIVGVAVGAITTFIAVWLWVVLTWPRL
jgi:hypothetical protein